jgi:hypothetical protein
MTFVERLGVMGLMALSAGLGATGAVYLRPLQPAQPPQQAEITPVMPRPPPIRTVTWFKAHPAEMTAKLAACGDNPGVGRHDPECLNADEASSKLSWERQLAEAKAHGVLK